MPRTRTINVFFCLFSFFLANAQTNSTNVGANSGTQGDNNTLVGFRSGQVTTANNNSFLGAFSGRQNIDGQNNTFVGHNAGRNNVSGNNNLFIGQGAGRNLVDGNRNVFLGPNAGNDASGSRNVFIGFQAGSSETGNNMLIINNNDANTPLVYGNFGSGQLAINTTTMPAGTALTVGGNALVDGALTTNGKLSIGTTIDDPDYQLTVKGAIHVQEVKVDLLGAIAPDYVFYEDYDLNTLQEVADFIAKEGHLPNIPSAKEMEEVGLHLKEMNLKLLEKIEELTLYLIDQNKTLEEQKITNGKLHKRLQKLESILVKE
ncbi:hypothetical protein FK220_006540 [Flavobacteriaceae bacterium TP-CH-4]|uniref:BZIP transcription factor n=1 Tax=Pelagihabitans pacificus TaxID=2696054 RepID=A0A967ARW2_9FLAO|nr:tail fiber protein [Pelagihabitans pacificus]NHF58989.1 hypothetical protein [Pelagihabitans pacificus]